MKSAQLKQEDDQAILHSASECVVACSADAQAALHEMQVRPASRYPRPTPSGRDPRRLEAATAHNRYPESKCGFADRRTCHSAPADNWAAADRSDNRATRDQQAGARRSVSPPEPNVASLNVFLCACCCSSRCWPVSQWEMRQTRLRILPASKALAPICSCFLPSRGAMR
jgi:hypothetical protein